MSSPMLIEPAAASRPPINATTARKMPLTIRIEPSYHALARVARSLACKESWLVAR
jgi:hypothetical protein